MPAYSAVIIMVLFKTLLPVHDARILSLEEFNLVLNFVFHAIIPDHDCLQINKDDFSRRLDEIGYQRALHHTYNFEYESSDIRDIKIQELDSYVFIR